MHLKREIPKGPRHSWELCITLPVRHAFDPERELNSLDPSVRQSSKMTTKVPASQGHAKAIFKILCAL